MTAVGALRPGMMLSSRFELVRRLGAGGLAEVWVAKDRVAGAEVAVKALHEHLAADAGLVERFRREMAVTRGLHHPGIVRVFDLYEHEGRPFFTMELLRGRSLAEALRAGALPADEARRIARQIAVALQAAHRAGVVHRDLKPHNVWLTETGAVKLLDFGLARAAGWARLTAQSTVLGTPGYMAPEVLSGQGADARADLYALGATLFEMLTGKRAFPSADAYTALRRKHEAPPDPGPQVGEAERSLVRRALDPDPEKRFLDAGQMLRELDGERAPPALAAPPPLTAGGFDVVVGYVGGPFGARKHKKALARVTARLGADAPRDGWRLFQSTRGRNTLVCGASRETADAVAALCLEEGIPVAIEPTRPPGRIRRFLARHGRSLGAALGAAAAGLLLRSLGRGLFGPLSIEEMIADLKRRGMSAEHIARQLRLVADQEHHFSLGYRLLENLPMLSAMAIIAFLFVAGGSSYLLSAAELPPVLAGAPPRKRRGRFTAWIRRHALKICIGGGALAALAQGWELTYGPEALRSIPAAIRAELAFGWGVLVAWLGWFAIGPRPRPLPLQPGDTGVRRIEAGIARRIETLRGRIAGAPGPSRMLLEEMSRAADDVERAATALAESAAGTGEHERDKAVDRLLEMAAALDDALAAAGGGPRGDGPRPEGPGSHHEPSIVRANTELRRLGTS